MYARLFDSIFIYLIQPKKILNFVYFIFKKNRNCEIYCKKKLFDLILEESNFLREIS